MAKNFETGLIITGDSTGGVRAVRATRKEIDGLSQGFDRGGKRAQDFAQRSQGVSRELQAMRRLAAPVGAAIAGMFAVNGLRNQIDFADQLQKTNLRIGASTEALSQYNHVAGLAGVQFNELTTAWQRQSRRVAQAAQDTGEAQEALATLNLDAAELAKLAPEKQFERIAGAMGGVANEAQRVALAQKIWDSEGVKLLQIVNQGTDAIRAQREEADRLGLTISQDTANAMASFNDEVTQLQAVTEGLSRQILADLVPSLTSGMQATSAWIDEMGGAEEILDTIKMTTGGLATLLAGRYAGALASSTAGMVAKTAASIADAKAEATAAQQVARRTAAEKTAAMALLASARTEEQATRGTAAHRVALDQLSAARVRATEAAGAHTAATNTAAAAMGRASVAARGLAAASRAGAAALSLVGGPLGLLVGAGGLLYVFRDELNLTGQRIGLTEDQVSDFQDELDDMSNKDMSGSLDSLNAELREATLTAAAAREELAKLKAESNDPGPFRNSIVQGSDADARREAYNARAAAEQNLAEIEQKRNMARVELWGRWSKAIVDNTDTRDDNAAAIKSQTTAADELSKKLEKQREAAESLLDQLYPVLASQREYAEQKKLLTQYAEREGKNNQWLEESLQRLQNQYRNAGTAAEAYGLDGSKAMAKVEDSVDPMVKTWERGIERMDDAGVDFWRGLLDGSTNAMDSLEDIVLDGVAEIAHNLTTRKLIVPIQAAITGEGQAGAGSVAGQSGGGGFGQIASMGSNMLNTGGQVFTNAWNAFQGAGSTYAGQFGADLAVQTQGGLEAGFNSFANSGAASNALSGVYTAGAGLAGGYVGNHIGGSISDKQKNSNYGQMAGTAIGSIWGPIGAGVGAALGSVVDTLFGSGGSDLDLAMVRGSSDSSHNWDHGVRASGALGSVGFQEEGSHELLDLWNKEDAQAVVDAVAQVDTLFASIADNDAELQSMQNAVLASNRHGIQGHYGETSNPGDVIDRLTSRYRQAFEAVGSEFMGLFDDMARLDPNAKQIARYGVALDGIEDAVGSNAQAMDDARAAIQRYNGSAEKSIEAAESMASAAQVMDLLDSASDRLGIQFDATAEGAIQAASDLEQLAGGIGSLSSLQQNYYDTMLTAEQRYQHMQSDMRDAFAELGLVMPDTRAGFRDLVEAQNLSTKAGRKNYTQLLQLVGGFDQLRQAASSLDGETGNLTDRINGLKDDVRSAWETFDKQQFDQRISLLELAGKSEEALALQRERELETIDKSLRPFQERYWALQDEAEAQQEAAQAGREYAEALASARDSLGSTFDNISSYLDQLRSTDQGGGTPREQLTAARSAFNEQLQAARGGDRTALQNITQYADRLISAQRSWSASGGATSSIIERIENQLGNLPDQVSAEEYIADEIKAALVEQTAGITSELADVLRSDTPSNIAQQLAGSFDDLTRGIGDVLTREQLAIVMDGKATDAQLDAVMRAVDLNGDGVMSGLESVIIKSMPTDATLANALQNQLEANGNKALTADQVREALSPIASDERINQLIERIDVNGDGLLSAQEITSARIGGLSGSIAQSLSGYFDELDANLDGKLTFEELSKGLDGLATDAQLRAMMQSMDLNADGVISGLESVIISEMPTDGRLATVLRNQMHTTRTRQLTHAQVREALSPVASKAVINRLINKADRNADGIITAQELNSIRIGELTDSVISTLDASFDQLDANLDGKLTFSELKDGLDGMATNNQIRAMMRASDLNADGVISGLEAVVIKSMPNDSRLTNVLRNQMERSRNQALSVDEVRAALNPIASKAVINRLINRADKNSDGIITAQELANARLDGLAQGIGGALSPMFDTIDSSLDGLINYDEFGKQFAGMASDKQLKRIFDQLDVNGDGTISRLEAMKHSTDEVGDNTKSIEERALEQVSKLGDLVTDMTASADQLVSLDSSVSDLAGVIAELNALQQQRAQEQRQHEQKMAQMAYYDNRQNSVGAMIEGMEKNQEAMRQSRENLNSNQIQHLSDFVASNQAQGPTAGMDQEDWERIRDNIDNNDNLSFDAKRFVRHMAAYRLRRGRLNEWENIVAGHEYSPDSLGLPDLSHLPGFAKGGVFTNSIVDKPTMFNMAQMGEATPEAIMPLHRGPDGGLGIRAELPPIPALPLLGQSDIVETLNDLRREVAGLRAENARLLGESNEHLGAANRQRGEGMKRQIEATERGNESLDRISSESQLMEAAR